LAYQARNTSDDFLSSLKEVFWFKKKSLYFVLWANTDATPDIKSEVLHGQIFVFATKEHWKKHARTRTRGIIYGLNNLSLSEDKPSFLEMLGDFDNEAARLKEYCSFHVKFYLLRNGEVFFDALQFVDDKVQSASLEDASKKNHDLDQRLVDQCFFFLRDLAHNHQHHAPDCDMMLTLQRFDPSCPDAWKRNVAYALQYYVIASKRKQDKTAMADALGILAYRSAFIDNVDRGSSKSIPDDKHLRDSLRARIEDEPARGELLASAQILIGLYALFIGILAILLQPVVDGEAVRKLIGDDEIGKKFLVWLPRVLVVALPEIIVGSIIMIPLMNKVFFIQSNRKAQKSVFRATIIELYALVGMLSRFIPGMFGLEKKISFVIYFFLTLFVAALGGTLYWAGVVLVIKNLAFLF
jgi:hypothetical protein